MMRKVLTVVFLVCLAVSLDWGLYYAFPQIDKDQMDILQLDHPYYGFGFHKNTSVVLPFGHLRIRYFTNSLGMRNRCVRDVSLVSDKRRILFIGDSFIEGVGCDYDSTFAGLLSAMTDTAHVEILNAGTRMYCPGLDYWRVKYLLEKEHLKINDLYCALTSPDVMDELIFQNFRPDTSARPDHWIGNLAERYKKHSVIWFEYTQWASDMYAKKNELGAGNNFLYFINTDNKYNEETEGHFMNYRIAWSDSNLLRSAIAQKALQLSFDNLKKIRQLCRENNIAFHLVTIPYGYTISSQQSPKAYKSMNASFVSLFQRFAAENGIDFVDLYPLFTSDDEEQNIANFHKYFIDGDEHWNAAGHRKVADSLKAVISR